MMFFIPTFIARFLAMDTVPPTIAVLRGVGGLITGSGAINYFLRNQTNADVIRGLLLANVIMHSLGSATDIWGIADGALYPTESAPVELTHLFVGIGLLICLPRLNTDDTNSH